MILKLGSNGPEVISLQTKLKQLGYAINPDGDFGGITEAAVKKFQKSKGLLDDGKVGNDTMSAIDNAVHSTLVTPNITPSGIPIIDCFLEEGEYYKEIVHKNTIYLHHTAGNASAKNVILSAWENDKNKAGGKLPVATAFVIGGFMKDDPNMDGAIYRAFDDKYWAHHLGSTTANNTALNKQSVAIEVCSWGPLTLAKDGTFLNYVGRAVPPSAVCKLSTPFKGFTYYHRYSDKQIESVRLLLIHLRDKYGINISKDWTAASFELSQDALQGNPGLYVHTNVRKDKSDMFPQPELIQMLNSL